MIRRRLSRLGLLAALLALVGQIAAGAVVPRPAVAALGHDAPCHAEEGKAPAHDRQRPPDCALCPFCLAFAQPAPPLALPPPLAPPSVVWVACPTALPPTRAPPALPFPAARPRGPPIPA